MSGVPIEYGLILLGIVFVVDVVYLSYLYFFENRSSTPTAIEEVD